MGWEILAPFAKWGAALIGAVLFASFVVRAVRNRAIAETERDQLQGVGDALSRFQKAERDARDLSRAELDYKLRDIARRRKP